MSLNQSIPSPLIPLSLSSLASKVCVHCGSQITAKRNPSQSDQNEFCCTGCEFVYTILNAKGLSRYYDLRKKAAPGFRSGPVTPSAENFSYLDEPTFKQSFCGSESAGEMDFYLEGIHCVACLWLIEKLPVLVSDVSEARLDFGRSIVAVKIHAGSSFAKVARELERLGYRPHPVQKNGQAEELQNRENRSWLVRLGVAGACSGNIMLLAVSLYAGADGVWADYFRWISLGLFLPVVCFSAVPFYKSAWTAIKTRNLSIDVPIVVALLMGSIVSALHTFQGSEHVYYDSLSALIFLLLSTRFFLRRIQQKTLGRVHLLQFLSPASARLYDPVSKQVQEISSSLLKVGDRVEVLCGAPMPADGVVVEGVSTVNCSLLTGESQPQSISKGDLIFTGTINEGDRIIIQVKVTGTDTRLGQILKGLDESSARKAPIVQAADRLSKWFLIAVFAAAFCVLLLASDWSVGLNRALALMIVTCPCALALATPLTMSLALQKAAAEGMLIKNSDVIEKLNKIVSVVLDKTGTVTTGHFDVFFWKDFGIVADLRDIVINLEAESKHPVAKALVRYLERSSSRTVTSMLIESYEEVTGVGVKGFIDGAFFEVKSLRNSSPDSESNSKATTKIGIYRDGILVAEAALGDLIRVDSKKAVENLKRLRLESYILSGDRPDVVADVAGHLGLEQAHAVGGADPLAKRDFIEVHPQSFMVGDGANDALALSASYVSAAVHGSMEVSLRAADVYLSKPGVVPICDLIFLARRTMAVIHRNFAFSLFYNLVGGLAAATGYITPLMAALLMPLSALTVFGSALIGSRNFLPKAVVPKQVTS